MALATVWSIGPVAACELVVRQTPSSVVLNYDVFGFQAAVVSAELILSNQSGTAENETSRCCSHTAYEIARCLSALDADR